MFRILLLSTLVIALPVALSAAPTSVDLSTYVQVGRFALPTNAVPVAGSLLAQEVSAITFNRDTNSLFVVGDGTTSVVQVTKTGQLIDSMTLARGAQPQGGAFYDSEGLAYVGGGRFVFVEERFRQLRQFTYAAGTTLGLGDVQTVDLGTNVGNIGIEGLSFDPSTNGFIAVKQEGPQGIFQTQADFAAGTATNGSSTTVNSTNLFDPALLGLTIFSDVFALSNVAGLTGTADEGNLLVLSAADGRIVETTRSGQVLSSLSFVAAPTETLSIADQQFEGLTIDDDGILYVTTENGLSPQLFVFAPQATAVPEPMTAGLLLAGLGALGVVRRRR